ncbi:MAG: hypothetical protein IJZ74_05285 [Clostridia bacterium]|nr:hypothetical protein [Clostridia bacterium]
MRERLEYKTHKGAVILTTVWPMLLALLLMVGATMLILPVQAALLVSGLLLLVIIVTFALCLPSYLGTYLFLPATAYKGARILARLGRNETEIHGVCVPEVLVKQNFIEKACKVCHLRVKGTAIYLRGVPDPETVKVWIAANFPAEPRPAAKKKGKKKK